MIPEDNVKFYNHWSLKIPLPGPSPCWTLKAPTSTLTFKTLLKYTRDYEPSCGPSFEALVQNVFFPNQSVTRTNQAGYRSTLAADTTGDVLLQHNTPSSPDRVVQCRGAWSTYNYMALSYKPSNTGDMQACVGGGVLLSIMFWADLPCCPGRGMVPTMRHRAPAAHSLSSLEDSSSSASTRGSADTINQLRWCAGPPHAAARSANES